MRELVIKEINAIAGAVAGLATDTMTLPAVSTVAGWVGGGILGTVGGAASYAGTCWWNNQN